MRVGWRIDSARTKLPRARAGLIAVAGHLRVKKFDSYVAVFAGVIVADPDPLAADGETNVALIEAKVRDVRRTFRPYDHLAILKRNHQEVVIVPRHGPFQRPQRDRKYA